MRPYEPARRPAVAPTSDAGAAGLVRLGAFSFKKFVYGRCSHCCGWRWIAVEPRPENPEDGDSSAIATLSLGSEERFLPTAGAFGCPARRFGLQFGHRLRPFRTSSER